MSDKTDRYSTDEIFANAVSNREDPPVDVMYDEKQARKEKDRIRLDIERYVEEHDSCHSVTDFIENQAGISKGLYSRFMNSDAPTGLSRDSLLKIFIVLGYDIDHIRTLLHRFGVPDLYARNRRDYEIIRGIASGKTLRDIDDDLDEKGMKTLWKEA